MLRAAESTTGRLGAGADLVQRVVAVNQKPIGRTPRSNLATYLGFFDEVRRLFRHRRGEGAPLSPAASPSTSPAAAARPARARAL